MAQISLEEIYRGENAGKKYSIMGAVFTDMYTNGVPSEYDENTWREMLFVKHTLMAAEQMIQLIVRDTILFLKNSAHS